MTILDHLKLWTIDKSLKGDHWGSCDDLLTSEVTQIHNYNFIEPVLCSGVIGDLSLLFLSLIRNDPAEQFIRDSTPKFFPSSSHTDTYTDSSEEMMMKEMSLLNVKWAAQLSGSFLEILLHPLSFFCLFYFRLHSRRFFLGLFYTLFFVPNVTFTPDYSFGLNTKTTFLEIKLEIRMHERSEVIAISP